MMKAYFGSLEITDENGNKSTDKVLLNATSIEDAQTALINLAQNYYKGTKKGSFNEEKEAYYHPKKGSFVKALGVSKEEAGAKND